MEAGRAVAGSSRRAVLGAVGIDPESAEQPNPQQPAETSWAHVTDARSLLQSLAVAVGVEVDLDREGWRQALQPRKDQPWHKRESLLVFATEDPVDLILEIVDRAVQPTELSPGRAAKQQDALAEAMRAAEAMRWSLATRVDPAGCLSLYIGSQAVVEQKVSR